MGEAAAEGSTKLEWVSECVGLDTRFGMTLGEAICGFFFQGMDDTTSEVERLTMLKKEGKQDGRDRK